MPSTTMPIAKPVIPLKKAHNTAPAMANGTRENRSAYCAIGTCSASATSDTAATSVSTPLLSRSNASRMLGSSTPKAARSSSSTALSPKSTTSGNADSPWHRSRNHSIG